MARRPLCLACLLLMLAMAMADLLGMPLIRGNPLPKSVSEYLKKHPGTTICGEVERCAESENSKSVYLKNVYFIYQSKKIPIKNVRVFLKNQETFSKAKSVANVRSSVKGRSSVNADKGLGDKCGVSVDTDKDVLYKGMMVRVKGRLEEIQGKRNPGEFDSRQYYACQHIYYVMKKAVIKEKSSSYSVYGQFLVDLQQYLGDILYQAAGKEGEVLKAIVLGDKTGLEDETKLRYQMGGILHILAISGLHISIIGMGFYRFLKKCYLGNWTAGMIALVFMIQYGMMTGGSVSVMRAVCMFLMAAGARILGRIYDLPTALAASAVLILLESPAYLYSSGFLLSFSAVFGAGIIYPYLEKKARKNNFALFTYHDDTIITDTPENEHIQNEARLNNLKVIKEEEFSVAIDFAPCKCMLVSDDEEALVSLEGHWKRRLNGALDVFRSEPYFLEVVPCAIDKANTLGALLEELDVKREEVIAIGDGVCDVTMIQLAGLGVAMGHSQDSVKVCADYVTASNEEDGVALAVEKAIIAEVRAAEIPLDQLNAQARHALMGNLGIQYTYADEDRVEATMPVDHRTRQPFGILHGGATLALGETVAGLGSMILCQPDEIVVGMQVSGNHISSAHEGDTVRAVATIVHKGRSSHVWNVDVFTSTNKLVSSIRVVNSVMKKR